MPPELCPATGCGGLADLLQSGAGIVLSTEQDKQPGDVPRHWGTNQAIKSNETDGCAMSSLSNGVIGPSEFV